MRSLSIGLLGGIAVLATVFVYGQFVRSGMAQGPAACTDNSTPLQCYTAGLSQIGAARAEMQKTEADFNAKIKQLQAQIDILQRIAAPPGSVLAFALGSCPEGWSKYEAAVGRFVRGIDPAAGSRQVGSVEEDAFQGHTFGDGGGRMLRWSAHHTNMDPPNGFSNMQSTGIFGVNNVFDEHLIDAIIVSDGKDGPPRVADETRPKNIGLLYCKRDEQTK
jgi:hypothetical protein